MTIVIVNATMVPVIMLSTNSCFLLPPISNAPHKARLISILASTLPLRDCDHSTRPQCPSLVQLTCVLCLIQSYLVDSGRYSSSRGQTDNDKSSTITLISIAACLNSKLSSSRWSLDHECFTRVPSTRYHLLQSSVELLNHKTSIGT